MAATWRQELDVDNWAAASMKALGVPYNQQRAMSAHLVNALKGSDRGADGRWQQRTWPERDPGRGLADRR